MTRYRPVVLPSDIADSPWYYYSAFTGITTLDPDSVPLSHEDLFPEWYRSLEHQDPKNPTVLRVDELYDGAREAVLRSVVQHRVRLFYGLFSPSRAEYAIFRRYALDVPNGWQRWDKSYLDILLQVNVDNLMLQTATGEMLIVYESWDQLFITSPILLPDTSDAPPGFLLMDD